MPNKKYYITTTLPYVNADPHIGFALETVQTDVLARWRRLHGDQVIFSTGTDEHGQKIFLNAQEAGMETKEYCDSYAKKFNGLKKALNLSYTNFIRTTDENHIKAAQEFWKRCEEAGDIYKDRYQVKYCVGCELEKTNSELEDGHCPIHPNLEIEQRNEENYFFRWSKYADALTEHYKSNTEFVVPPSRLKEISSFVAGGLHDFSISRLATKMPWGIPVPGDEDHVMYVWFDALVNYISTLGWPDENSDFSEFWPGTQTAGKDNLRQQSAMWQAMLLSVGLPMSKQIFIHGFVTAEGKKMSKSLGNVINPYDLVDQYGTDPVRYFLVSGLPSYEDGDFSKHQFEDVYSARLANGVGNLSSRIATMVSNYCEGKVPERTEDCFDTVGFWKEYEKALETFRFDEAGRVLDRYIAAINKAIDDEVPFKKVKEGVDVSPFMYQLAEALRHVGTALLPIIPDSAEKILDQFNIDSEKISLPDDQEWGRLESGESAIKGDVLFPRLAS